MMKYLFTLCLIAQVSLISAQFAAVYTNTTFTRLENDSAILTPAEGLRGSFQWQKSSDSITWIPIEANREGGSFALVPEQNEVYRLQITEGTCAPMYSDTIKVFSRHTAVSDYLLEGIALPDLNAAGVSVADLMAMGYSVLDLFHAGILVGTLEQEGIDSLVLADAGLIGELSDIDNNKYKWLKINDQVWMAENISTTHYPDGTAIPHLESQEDWGNLDYTDEAYCSFNNSTNLDSIYGKLYTWEASLKVCPGGWHLPDKTEWAELSNYLGGNSAAGGKMKETGTAHWEIPNAGATNESGFNALPGGYRNTGSGFGRLIVHAHFWSASELDSMYAGYSQLYFGNGVLIRNYQKKKLGFSVRCIRD